MSWLRAHAAVTQDSDDVDAVAWMELHNRLGAPDVTPETDDPTIAADIGTTRGPAAHSARKPLLLDRAAHSFDNHQSRVRDVVHPLVDALTCMDRERDGRGERCV